VDAGGWVTGVTAGTATVTVSVNTAAGPVSRECTVTVTAAPAPSQSMNWDIYDLATWNAAIALVNAMPNGTSGNPQVFSFNIVGDFPVPGLDTSTYTITGDYKTVWLTGTKTIRLSSNGSLIRTAGWANQTFIIDGITLAGKADKTENDAPLVFIAANSAVELRGGEIKDNDDSSGGGGVTVIGTFAMSGGTISGNTGAEGGGVSVYSGTITMSGGAISGNTAIYGGGVHLGSNSTFTMTGGAISGNTAKAMGGGVATVGTITVNGGTISGNTANQGGGGVYVEGTDGTFTKTGGTIYGDTNNTHTPGSTENTATDTANQDTNGHAVLLFKYPTTTYYYRNETLTGADNISTADLTTNWTQRP
jgi:hypothetical protein